jgi:hypothetical protein
VKQAKRSGSGREKGSRPQLKGLLSTQTRTQRRAAPKVEAAAVRSKAEQPRKTNQPRLSELEQTTELRWGKSIGSKEHPELSHIYEVLERRRSSILTCERGLRSALASGDERLVRRWSRSLREAEVRLAWAEADLARAEKRSDMLAKNR